MSEAIEALGGSPTPAPSPTPTPTPAPAPAPSADPGAAPAAPAWMTGLSDDLRSDPDLARYDSVEALAKGLKETRTWARGRMPLPTDDASWQELGQKLRPENLDGYKIDVPEGDSGEFLGRYKQFAFDEGIPPRWAERTAAWWNREQAEAISRQVAQNKAEVQALDLELGTHAFNVRAEAVANMFSGLGIENFDAVKALESTQGAGSTLKVLFALAERTGELEKVDGAAVALRSGSMSVEQAKAEFNRLSMDKSFMDKAKVAGTPERKKMDALNEAMARGA